MKADSLIKLGKGIIEEVMNPTTEGATEVVSEDKNFVASMKAIDS